MRLLTVLPIVALLAACGADGEPIRPNAGVNLNVNKHGVHANPYVGVSAGPVHVSLGR